MAPVLAQDAQEERDRSFLTALIEDNLAAPGLSVRIDGFEGALSTRATLERLIVSDDEGPWLRLEDVALDWNRGALLRGRLEVQELTAALIQLERAPLPPEGVDLPEAGASEGFSLPDIPVSIQIDRIAATRIDIGAPLLGQELAFQLEAAASLIDGSADIGVEATRLDGPSGTFAISATFDGDTSALSVDLDLSEEEEGIAATMIGLPGQPALDLSVEGSGPLSDFTADVTLASDGVERLGGAVRLLEEEGGQRFGVDLSGDVTPLFAPRFQAFFGPDTRLVLDGLSSEQGLALERLDIRTEALSLAGAARFDPGGWPTFLDIEGQLADEGGDLVLLPTSDIITLRSGRLTVQHDAAQSESWALLLDANEVSHPAALLDRVTLTGDGILDRDGGAVTGTRADLAANVQGLALADPSLAEAVGSTISFRSAISWQDGDPVDISDMVLDAQGLTLSGALQWVFGEERLPLALNVAADIPDLRRVAALAGVEDLRGAADARLIGRVSPLRGAFDLSLASSTDGLGLGIPQADAMIGGASTLNAQARRDISGTYLDSLSLENDAVTISGRARILTEDSPQRRQGAAGEANLDIEIADGTGLDPRLAGPITARVALGEGQTGAWTGNAAIRAPNDVTLNAAGRLTGPTPDVRFDAGIPRIADFVEGIPGALSAEGRATAIEGVWSIDARANGPWDVVANVDGAVNGPEPGFTFSARLPDLTAPVPALSALPALAGPAELEGRLDQQGLAWVLDARAGLPEGVVARVRGPVNGPAPALDISATVPDVSSFVPGIPGTLSLDAELARQGEDWAASLRANGPFDARATAETVLTQSPLSADFALQVPRIAALAPGIPGGLDVTGNVLQAPAGWRVTLDGTGPYGADISAQARLSDAGPDVDARLRLPDTRALAPQVSGPLSATISAQQRQGVWRANVAANGPLGSDATISGVVAGAPLDIQVNAGLPDVAALVPDISGPLRISGQVSQPGTAYAVDLDVTGLSGLSAAINGNASAGGTLDLGIVGQAPLGLANGILSPRRIGGTAAFDLRLAGPPSVNSLSGTIRTSGAELSLPTLRNGLSGIDTTITLSNGQAQVNARADLRSGGQLSVSGPIGLSAPFNGNLAAEFGVVLEDPTLYRALVIGNVGVNGPLAGGALISGQVTIDEAEITVPSSGLTAIGDLPPITHLSTPRPVQRTLDRAGQSATPTAEPRQADGPAYGLDLTISAPSRIFVRGRGLDAALGGTLRLTGTTASPITSGAFELARGRLDILQQRFDLDEGQISFQGSLIPFLRLVAVTQTSALTASIIIEGPADDIEVRFASSPEVPQEEILAQIFFGRDLSQLSPVQALQLANSIAVLAGRSSGGLLERLRGTTGLDDLDVTSDGEGNTAVRAGKYISDNVYTDVEIDQDGNASVSLNLDLTPNLTVRGSTGASGESSLGIFFERDY